jgi:hypothetical protein
MTNVSTDRTEEDRILVEKKKMGGVIKKVVKEKEEEIGFRRGEPILI